MTRPASRSPRPCSTTTCRAPFELPPIKIGHLHTPATATEYGMKGMGEGGAVAPPAAIANAVRDALAGDRRRGQRDPDHRAPRPGGDPKGTLTLIQVSFRGLAKRGARNP